MEFDEISMGIFPMKRKWKNRGFFCFFAAVPAYGRNNRLFSEIIGRMSMDFPKCFAYNYVGS